LAPQLNPNETTAKTVSPRLNDEKIGFNWVNGASKRKSRFNPVTIFQSYGTSGAPLSGIFDRRGTADFKA